MQSFFLTPTCLDADNAYTYSTAEERIGADMVYWVRL
jgi:hypothetical protein